MISITVKVEEVNGMLAISRNSDKETGTPMEITTGELFIHAFNVAYATLAASSGRSAMIVGETLDKLVKDGLFDKHFDKDEIPKRDTGKGFRSG